MRKLASIREISAIHPIPGADRIEVAQVDGWECVVQKGEFQVGQHIVYVEVDSMPSQVQGQNHQAPWSGEPRSCAAPDFLLAEED